MPVTIGADRPTLEVITAEGETYHVPLLASLKPERAKDLTDALSGDGDSRAILMDFFGEYIPKEVMDETTLGDQLALAKAWNEESEQASGLLMGESQASPAS